MRKLRIVIAMSIVGMYVLAGCGSSTADTTTTVKNAGYTESTTAANQAAPTTNENTNVNNASDSYLLSTDEGLICPYCGLVYTGTGNDNLYSHITACAQATGDSSTLSKCSYCGELFSAKYKTPSGNGVTIYEEHMAQEEWAHREYVMCQKCGEYYKNGEEHICNK